MRRFPCAIALTPAEQRDFLPDALATELHGLASEVRLLDTNGTFAAALAAAAPEVLVASWSTPPLPEAPPASLRYICYLAGSVKRLVRRRHLENGLLVTNWGGSISRTVAEGALWHILNGLRRGTHWTLAMHQDRAWKSGDPETASLFGRRVGLHGFGHVARELVALLRPFGCTITVSAPDLDADTARDFGVAPAASLESLFDMSDIVVEVAPLNAATRGVVTADLLQRLQPGSVFVNVGRGAVVDEAALVRIAQRGDVHFGLDVFTSEPLPADSPLRGLRNVALTPHLAGPTNDRRADAGAFALANLRAFAAGRPLRAVITPAVYDAST
ncbi:MAG TPA: hydroxyacid dehydrogenase [Opitutus sp.]|nr:hydroxyacid dehydrogenase [Opitutus sp.]